MAELQFHSLAALFPVMGAAELDALTSDIREHGLQQPIALHEGKILDGRNRYRACRKLRLTPATTVFNGSDPLAFIVSANLHRRHLSESQRGYIAAKLETMKHGQRADLANRRDAKLHISRKAAAAMMGVSERTVAAGAIVRDKGVPKLARRVERGEIAVSVAAKIAQMPKQEQERVAGDDEASLRGAAKRHARAKKETALAEATVQASKKLGVKLYGVIYADPPWRFEPYSRDTGMDRAADNHYPTLTLDDIKAIKPPAAKDAVLFMWATVPMLPDAIEVMRAWGFAYRSHCIWLKDRVGTGYWFRNKHELLLVGTRGDIPAPAQGQQYESVIAAKLARHSDKPIAFAEMIEKLFPNVPGVEMFARGPRLGWDAWGNEAPQ